MNTTYKNLEYWEMGFYHGINQEQQRIIELLERMPRTDNDRTVDVPTLIDLIKGENK